MSTMAGLEGGKGGGRKEEVEKGGRGRKGGEEKGGEGREGGGEEGRGGGGGLTSIADLPMFARL